MSSPKSMPKFRNVGLDVPLRFHRHCFQSLVSELLFSCDLFLGTKWHVWLVKLNQYLVQNHCWSFIMWAFVFTMKFHWHCFQRFVSEFLFFCDLFSTGTKWQVWLVKLNQCLVQNHYWSFIIWAFVLHYEISLTLFSEVCFRIIIL